VGAYGGFEVSSDPRSFGAQLAGGRTSPPQYSEERLAWMDALCYLRESWRDEGLDEEGLGFVSEWWKALRDGPPA
jgi:hypothetical protein